MARRQPSPVPPPTCWVFLLTQSSDEVVIQCRQGNRSHCGYRWRESTGTSPSSDMARQSVVRRALRRWANHERDDNGLALLVDGQDPNGVLASTGLTKGLGPHLEVYLR